MHFSSVTKGLLFVAAVTVSSSALAEVQKISICHAALVELASFDKHLNDIRASKTLRAGTDRRSDREPAEIRP
jgi:hypothetical protein